MQPRYTICFAGDLLEGQQLADVRSKLAKLFNADAQTLDRLFSGKIQVLKRDCDKATAAKYQQAMEHAGARPIIRISPEAAPAPAPAQPAPGTMTAAEKIAALAAAPDENRFRAGASGPAGEASAPAARATPVQGEPDLAPVGADLLRPEERPKHVSRDVDTAGLEVTEFTQRLSPEPPEPPAAPDTSHLDMGDVGDMIPGLPGEEPAPIPTTLSIDLAPVGADFSEFSPSEPEPPRLDLSGMELAPTGSEVLEEKYRQRERVDAPATDHISLEE